PAGLVAGSPSSGLKLDPLLPWRESAARSAPIGARRPCENEEDRTAVDPAPDSLPRSRRRPRPRPARPPPAPGAPAAASAALPRRAARARPGARLPRDPGLPREAQGRGGPLRAGAEPRGPARARAARRRHREARRDAARALRRRLVPGRTGDPRRAT